MSSATGVLLLSFGSPSGDAEVADYLARVRRGRPVPPELLADLRMRYRRVGGSPLVRITTDQAEALERSLNASGGGPWLVRAAMLHSAPFVADAVADLERSGVSSLVAVPMAPQESPHGSLYEEALRAAVPPDLPFRIAAAWHLDDAFIALLADGLRATLDSLGDASGDSARVLFTAHSLPRRVPGASDYAAQIAETAEAVASRLGIATYQTVFQSRSGPADEWLGPDILDVIPALAAEGCHVVVPTPVQFLADHLEVLYDLDIQVRELAEAHGLRYARPPSANTRAELIAVLESVVRRTAAVAAERA